MSQIQRREFILLGSVFKEPASNTASRTAPN
jgi:hypothetical protein